MTADLRSRRGRAPRALLLVLLVLLVPALDGCRSGRGKEKADPLMRLSAAESLQQGKALMEKKKWSAARKYLMHAFEVEPNSASGREALLLVADSLYNQGGRDNLVQAEAKYRDFLNRFPTSDKAPYVQYQIGSALAGRVERADRDQNVTRQALTAFEEVVRLYPTSDQVEPAKQRIAEMRAQLGEHEFMVARFYLRYGLPHATVNRLSYLLVAYPEYTAKDKVYYYLGMAHDRMHQPKEAAEWFTKLREEFPRSAYVKDIPAKLEKAPEKPVEKAEKTEKT